MIYYHFWSIRNHSKHFKENQKIHFFSKISIFCKQNLSCFLSKIAFFGYKQTSKSIFFISKPLIKNLTDKKFDLVINSHTLVGICSVLFSKKAFSIFRHSQNAVFHSFQQQQRSGFPKKWIFRSEF